MNLQRNIDLKKNQAIAIILSTLFISVLILSIIVPNSYRHSVSTSSYSRGVELYGTGFYDNIGEIFSAKTDDNINIKILRYHAPGATFNDGAQPVLLFPGILCNVNEFLSYSTPLIKNRFDMTLPAEVANWAIGDDNIQNDPLLYYSIAYYLWKIGYDPWFCNYRGIGYGDMRSEGGNGNTTIDHFALLDVKAAVKKVNEVTGLHPVIGGHSTGGLVSIMYLQGTNFGSDSHIYSSDDSVKIRNGIIESSESVAGFLAIDPAMIPVEPPIMNNIFTWELLSLDLVIDVRGIMEATMSYFPFYNYFIQEMIRIYSDAEALGETLTDLLKNVGNLDAKNINEEIATFFMTYAIDTLYYRTLSQYLDYSVHQCVREFWKNGDSNSVLLTPPEPNEEDNYYYYTDHMNKIQVPLLCFLANAESEIFDLVDADQIIRDLINGKTQTLFDEYYFIESAHIDIASGLNNPTDMFPIIGDWLAKISVI